MLLASSALPASCLRASLHTPQYGYVDGPAFKAFYGKRATPPAVAGESASATGALIAFESVVHEPPP